MPAPRKTPQEQSLEQKIAMEQMAAQAAPIMPPPPTPNPMSQLPVPPEMISNAQNATLSAKLKEQSLARESEMEKIKLYMQQYSQLKQGVDYRPIAALISGLTGNQQLMQAAEAIAPESKADIAKNMIGYQAKLAQLMGDQKQSEALLKNQTEMARLQYLAAKNQRADTNADFRKEMFLQGQVQKFEKAIEGKASLDNALRTLEGKLGFSLASYDPATNTVDGNPVDLPGVSIPGIGRASFYDKGARQIDDSMARIFNIELKDASGAAVTNQELERMKHQFSVGAYQTEVEKLTALKDYERLLNEEVQRRSAAYSPQVRQRYYEQLGQIESAGSVDPSKKTTAPTDFSEAKMKRLEELRRKAGQ